MEDVYKVGSRMVGWLFCYDVFDFARFVAGGHVTVTSCVNSRERRRNVLCTYGTHTLSHKSRNVTQITLVCLLL